MIGPGQWYELRVEGSAGIQAGNAQALKAGIAIAENGRLCPLASGNAQKFESKQQAMDYLDRISVPGNYHLEIVLCGSRAAA